ncbi:MAG: carboxypeptidase-like regulatory domain-containing protein, partial [Muribaculaceae bacterium]|nr:carboxypeptidase-like regulatory domain-containing protein [Muribaculaceae bacterium]
MRVRLFLLLLLSAVLPSLAQNATVTGTVVDASTGTPVAGAVVTLLQQGLKATTGPAGDFSISRASGGDDFLTVSAPGFDKTGFNVALYD